jgi:hypothetical protein
VERLEAELLHATGDDHVDAAAANQIRCIADGVQARHRSGGDRRVDAAQVVPDRHLPGRRVEDRVRKVHRAGVLRPGGLRATVEPADRLDAAEHRAEHETDSLLAPLLERPAAVCERELDAAGGEAAGPVERADTAGAKVGARVEIAYFGDVMAAGHVRRQHGRRPQAAASGAERLVNRVRAIAERADQPGTGDDDRSHEPFIPDTSGR